MSQATYVYHSWMKKARTNWISELSQLGMLLMNDFLQLTKANPKAEVNQIVWYIR